MKDKNTDNLKKLSRGELLEMLIDQSTRVEELEQQVSELKETLKNREIKVDNAGSIAEAALQLNGVFEAAEEACRQYKENIEMLSTRQEEVCARREAESKAEAERVVREAREKSEQLLADAREQSEKLLSDARKQSEETVSAAKIESNAYWADVSRKLEKFYNEHAGLRELLSQLPGSIDSGLKA